MVEPATLVSAGVMCVLLLGAVGLDQNNNPLKRSVQFRRRRLLNWVATGVLYASFYMARYGAEACCARGRRGVLCVRDTVWL